LPITKKSSVVSAHKLIMMVSKMYDELRLMTHKTEESEIAYEHSSVSHPHGRSYLIILIMLTMTILTKTIITV
jgi:hypothetical protein